MPDPAKRGYPGLQFSFGNADSSSSDRESEPLRLLVFGGFSGDASQDSPPLQDLDGVRIDYDNFDSVVARMQPLVRMGIPSSPAIRFQSLDDFHPDRLLLNFEPLAQLADLRRRLMDPSTSEEVASTIEKLLQVSPGTGSPPPDQSSDDSLKQLLSRPISENALRTRATSAVDLLIREIFAKPSDFVATEGQGKLQAALEKELANRLRATLHFPAFQRLESCWRGLDFLVRNAGESAKVWIADIAKSALPLLLQEGESTDAPLAGLLQALHPDVILGIYGFAPEERGTLGAIMRICDSCRTVFISGASPEWAGWKSFQSPNDRIDQAPLPEEQETVSLRKRPGASRLGLVLPRFLLRQTYGIRSDPIETFPFEEIAANPEHESYLWGDPAFLCGHLLSQKFFQPETDARDGDEISGLPVQQIVRQGETDMKPCAEVWLTDKQAEMIRGRGIIPVQSIRGRDAVRIDSLRSISTSPNILPVREE